ncbi:MAG: tRNA guanosine(15) transglycosylase TgtA [Candidatus Odinarchaeia archaeon]
MSFEIKNRDLLGRIGRLKTKSGVVETPILLPVINPAKMVVPPSKLKSVFNVSAVITNAYLLKKNFEEEVLEKGIHRFLGFNGPVMTDSGAYQLLVYGEVDISPIDVIHFQEKIDTDIAVFLDIPTGSRVSYDQAKFTVLETLKRAKHCIETRSRQDILWVGPIQGAGYNDLIEYAAKEMSNLPFDIYAIGSPTQFLEQYNYSSIINMVMISKRVLPQNKPIHLFGAGHPIIFSLAVAMGCDIFDSAAYALYAQADRYLTPYGTKRLTDINTAICVCPVCSKYTPTELINLPKEERIPLLAEHNLHISLSEINQIKLAIKEGRLWEYIELKARAHPKLLSAFKKLAMFKTELEKGTPTTKKRALFWLSNESVHRPEVTRHLNRLKKLKIPGSPEILVILPEPNKKPYSRANYNKIVLSHILADETLARKTQVATVSRMFGLVPFEIEEIYPLSQNLTPDEITDVQRENIIKAIRVFLHTNNFKKLVFIHNEEEYVAQLIKDIKKIIKTEKISFNVIKINEFNKGCL